VCTLNPSTTHRLSRKYAYQILLIEELGRNGVEMLFVKAPQGSSAEDQLLRWSMA
jgi:site-specific DNA recombinase